MRYPTPTVPEPDMGEMLVAIEASVMDTETHFETSDGCEVEADGKCSHGHPTWLVRFGLV